MNIDLSKLPDGILCTRHLCEIYKTVIDINRLTDRLKRKMKKKRDTGLFLLVWRHTLMYIDDIYHYYSLTLVLIQDRLSTRPFSELKAICIVSLSLSLLAFFTQPVGIFDFSNWSRSIIVRSARRRQIHCFSFSLKLMCL